MSQHAEMGSDPTTLAIACSAAAERMRAHRRRRRAGLRRVMVQLRETEIDELIRRKLLEADARNDSYAIRDALHTHFDHTLRTAK
jgi:SOS response regulatory protein OraA/RecX